MIELSKAEVNRLRAFGRKVWNGLTREEQCAFYYDTGTYGFVEAIAELLHIKPTILDEPTIDELQDYICEVKK